MLCCHSDDGRNSAELSLVSETVVVGIIAAAKLEFNFPNRPMLSLPIARVRTVPTSTTASS